MPLWRRLLGGILVVLGGGLTGMGTGLAGFILSGYVEWEASLSSAPVAIVLSFFFLFPGLFMLAVGGWLRQHEGLELAKSGLGVWSLVTGVVMVLSPIFNLIWGFFRGAAFAAPDGPLLPFVICMCFGVAMTALGLGLSPLKHAGRAPV